MTDGRTFKNLLKLLFLMIGGFVVFIYFILLVSGKIGKQPQYVPTKSTDPEEIRKAESTLEAILKDNELGFVVEFTDTDKLLTIKVNSKNWQKLSIKKRKEVLERLAKARMTLGKYPEIRVLSYKSNTELAAYERGRASVVDFEL